MSEKGRSSRAGSSTRTKGRSNTDDRRRGPKKSGTTANDPIEAIQSFARTSSKVVQQAAAILEEEIAAGIIAAKEVEKNFADVEDLRSRRPDAVVQRFRQDAHEVADLLTDMISIAANSLDNMVSRASEIRIDRETTRPSVSSSQRIVTLTVPYALRAGASGSASVVLQNDGDLLVSEFALRSTDLVGFAGKKIDATNVTFKPRKVALPPRGKQEFSINVSIPRGTPSGSYSGQIQSTGLQIFRALFVIEVA